MADNSAEIARLEAILSDGIQSQSVDGLSATRDLTEIRRRLAELRRDDDASIAAGKSRPKMVPYRF